MEQSTQPPEITDIRALQGMAIGREGLAKELILLAEDAKIENDEHVSAGVDHLNKITAVLKEMDEERMGRQSAIKDGIKMVNAAYKAISEPLEAAKKKLQGLLGKYQAEQDRKAQEAAAAEAKRLEDEALAEAKRIEDAAEAVAKELEEEGREDEAGKIIAQAAEEAGHVLEEAAEAPEPAPPPAQAMSGNYGGSAGKRIDWKWRLKKESDVPRMWFMLDEKKISAVVRSGTRKIPGLEIYPETTIIGRR